MLGNELLFNFLLLASCYAYILTVLFLSVKATKLFGISGSSSRKLLHILIGNLFFLLPLFTFNTFPLNFPFFVAVPFVFVTFFASSYSPSRIFREKLSGLVGITGDGHDLGLFYYSLSYTLLACFFASQPLVVAAGIIPLAYGDASAALIGEKFGKKRYRVFATRSLEGSTAMFLVSFLSLEAGLLFFSYLYSLSIILLTPVLLWVALVATFAEAVSPSGLDNIMVPLLGLLTFLLASGGILT